MHFHAVGHSVGSHALEGRGSLRSHSIFASPLLGCRIIPLPVRIVDLGNLGNESNFCVWIGHQRLDGEEDLLDGECRSPLVLKNVKENTSIRVDVWVIYACCEPTLGRLVWVIGRKFDF